MSSIDSESKLSSSTTWTQMSTRKLLVELRFETVVAQYTDQQPGYRYNFGNFVLNASQVTSEYLRPEILFTGIMSTPRVCGMVEFSLPLEVESYEQGVALIAYNIGNDFTPTRVTPWLLLGRMWKEHLPWRRDLRLYEQRPHCHVDAEWFRVAVKKLIAAGEGAGNDAHFGISFHDKVLTFDLSDDIVVLPAKGTSWPQAYRCRSPDLKHLSRRTPSGGVSLSIWEGCLQIGNRRLQLDVSPIQSTTSNAPDNGGAVQHPVFAPDQQRSVSGQSGMADVPLPVADLNAMFDEVLAEELAKVSAETKTQQTLVGKITLPGSCPSVGEIAASNSEDEMPANDVENADDEETDSDAEGNEGREPLKLVPTSDVELGLVLLVDLEKANRVEAQFAYGIESCDMCGCTLDECGLFVDGALRNKLGWANMCAHCFKKHGEAIGWGKGQLYARQVNGMWRLVAGFR